MAKSTFTAMGEGQFSRLFNRRPIYPRVGGHHELGDSLSGLEGEGRLAVVDEQHAHFAAIVGVDGAGRVQHRNPVFVCQSAAGSHLRFVSLWQFDVQSTGDQLAFPRLEYNGAIWNDSGLDVEALKAHITEHGSPEGFAGGEFVGDGAAMLERECDVLIPAALEGVINLCNAARIQAPLIIEAANGPVTVGADDILRDKGTVIIPDMYANVGGVTVSYFEWVKNLSHIRFGRMQRRQEENRHQLIVDELERISSDSSINWTISPDFKEKYLRGAGELELVRSGLDDTMRSAYDDMAKVWHGREDVHDLRTAAYLVAISKVAASYHAKGL